MPVPGGSSFIYKNDWRAGDAEERCQLSPVDAKKFFSFFRVGGYRRDAEVTCRTERDSVVTVGENTTNIFIPVERRETTGNM